MPSSHRNCYGSKSRSANRWKFSIR
jgi:hypothetical protein